MSIRRLLAVARKEFRHITRDVRTFFLVTVAPAFLLVTFSSIFALDVGEVRLAVHDLDQTALSRRLVASLTADGDFVTVASVNDHDEVGPLFTSGTADLVLVIPRGFADAAQSGRTAAVQAITDGADAITAMQFINMLESRVQAFTDQMRPVASRASGASTVVSSRAWYNGSLKSLYSMVPGLMAVLLCMPALALSLALTREKETGSFESLVATPVRGAEYLAGKFIAYAVSGMLGVVLAWLVAVLWFRVPFRGNLLLFLLLAADFTVASMGIGLLVATCVRTQQTAMFLMLMVFFVPSFFVAGLVVPVAEALFSRALAYSLPTTHFILICRGIFLKGLGLTDMVTPALALAGMGGAAQALSLVLFRKKVG